MLLLRLREFVVFDECGLGYLLSLVQPVKSLERDGTNIRLHQQQLRFWQWLSTSSSSEFGIGAAPLMAQAVTRHQQQLRVWQWLGTTNGSDFGSGAAPAVAQTAPSAVSQLSAAAATEWPGGRGRTLVSVM